MLFHGVIVVISCITGTGYAASGHSGRVPAVPASPVVPAPLMANKHVANSLVGVVPTNPALIKVLERRTSPSAAELSKRSQTQIDLWTAIIDRNMPKLTRVLAAGAQANDFCYMVVIPQPVAVMRGDKKQAVVYPYMNFFTLSRQAAREYYKPGAADIVVPFACAAAFLGGAPMVEALVTAGADTLLRQEGMPLNVVQQLGRIEELVKKAETAKQGIDYSNAYAIDVLKSHAVHDPSAQRCVIQ